MPVTLVSFFDEHISFSNRISAVSKSCYSHTHQLGCIRPYNLPNTQLNRLQHIQHSLAARAVIRPKVFPYQPCSQIFTQAIKFFLSRTKSLPLIPYNLIPVQPHRRTRVITLSRTPPSYSSLKVINSSFRHASPCL